MNRILEESTGGIATLNDDGCFIHLDEALCRCLGCDGTTLLQIKLWDLACREDRDQCLNAFRQLAQDSQNTLELEVRHERPTGQLKTLQISLSRSLSKHENHYFARICDANGRRDAFEELTAENSLLNVVLNHVNAHVYMKDRHGRYLYANPEAMKMLTPHAIQGSVIGKSDAELLPAKWAAPIISFDQEVLRNRGPLYREETFPTTDGIERVFLTQKIVHQLDGLGDCLIGLSTDITVLRQETAQLAASEEQFRMLAENSGDVVFLLERDGRVRWVSPSLTSALGWEPQDWIGQIGTQFLIHQGQSESYQANLQRLQDEQQVILARDQVWAKDHSLHWIETHASPYFNANGDVEGFVGHFHVIDDMVEAETQLRRSEQRHRLLADNMHDVVWAIDLQGQFTYMSPSVERTRGFTPEEIMALPLERQFTPQSYALVIEGLRQANLNVAAGQPVLFQEEVEELCKDGNTVWTEVNASSLYDREGNFLEIVGVSRDITEQRQVREQLRLSEERYRLLAENAKDVIWTMEPDGRLSYISPSIELLRGFTPEQAMAQPVEHIHPPDSVAKSQAYLSQLMAEIEAKQQPQSFRGELEYYCKNGSTIWTEVIAVPILNQCGQLEKLIGTSRDITERMRYEHELSLANQRLYALATTDGLTQISNRRHFESLIRTAISGSDRYGEPITLILCDIDHFKGINDQFGHQVGDQVLVEFCSRIQAHLRNGDAFGRWGGEEFLVLLPRGDAKAGAALAEKLRHVTAATAFEGCGKVTASFGVAQRSSNETEMEWFQRVDETLYAAKAAGRDRVVVAGLWKMPGTTQVKQIYDHCQV